MGKIFKWEYNFLFESKISDCLEIYLKIWAERYRTNKDKSTSGRQVWFWKCETTCRARYFITKIHQPSAWLLFRVQVIYWICWEMMLISINLIRRVRSIRTACRARFDLSSLLPSAFIQSGSIITLSTHFYSHLNNILWFCIVEELDLLNID